MANPVKAVPEGYQTVTPGLTIRGAARSIEFYARAFGARELFRMTCPETGAVMHAEIQIGDSRLFLNDEFPAMGARGPEALGGSPVTIFVYVEDVDAVFARAVEAGATATMPPANMFWGDRFAKVIDPFGHHWSLATHVEDVPPEQLQERMLEAMASMASA